MSLKIVINLSNNFKNYPELQNQHHHHRPCKSSSLTTLGQAVFKPLAYLFPSAVPFSTPATHSTSDPLPLPLSGPILYPSKHSTRVPVTPYLFPSAGHSLPQQHTVPVTPYLFPSAVPFSTPATHSTPLHHTYLSLCGVPKVADNGAFTHQLTALHSDLFSNTTRYSLEQVLQLRSPSSGPSAQVLQLRSSSSGPSAQVLQLRSSSSGPSAQVLQLKSLSSGPPAQVPQLRSQGRALMGLGHITSR